MSQAAFPVPDAESLSDPTPEKIKAAALKLFSSRGIDGVSVRDIVTEAGLRNGASLHYYFGSKDGLLRALVTDGARHSDGARARALAALEAGGGPKRVLDILRLLIDVETGLYGGGTGAGFGHMRFVVAMQINHRRLFTEALREVENPAYLRCLSHIRRLLPEIAEPVLNQRLILMYMMLCTALGSREAALSEPEPRRGLWGMEGILDNLARGMTAFLSAPSEEETGI
ncbi:TetR/AcrR family transcriptional regulator [Falsigemmobacter faecalis]|uniref:TetR/AcrR family transcriptional regulator n=1 Tax=Falsigemmobacter faecalis TaxID=2488730 RepID=A0A3P3DFH0_9RHOB|nr:TetR/AcrR family transcriptional regulator [Falsigemmobacter faecalis]RRH72406.1 TetR/AcrR family transcriptional regulator [Falsigemmobacter faecalis]